MPTTTQDNPAPCVVVHAKRNPRNPYATLAATPCRICGNPIQHRRVLLEKTTCIDCQADLDKTEPVRHTIVPLHKSNYIPVFNREDLKGINNKGGLIK